MWWNIQANYQKQGAPMSAQHCRHKALMGVSLYQSALAPIHRHCHTSKPLTVSTAGSGALPIVQVLRLPSHRKTWKRVKGKKPVRLRHHHHSRVQSMSSQRVQQARPLCRRKATTVP